jgi:hypothetical protein
MKKTHGRSDQDERAHRIDEVGQFANRLRRNGELDRREIRFPTIAAIKDVIKSLTNAATTAPNTTPTTTGRARSSTLPQICIT